MSEPKQTTPNVFAEADYRARETYRRLNGLYPMPPNDRAEWVMKQMLDGFVSQEGRGMVSDYLTLHFEYLQNG